MTYAPAYQYALAYACFAALAVGGVYLLARLTAYACRRLFGGLGAFQKAAVGCALVALVLYAGTKPPSGALTVTWDDYLTGTATANTNTWASATFTWSKTNTALPDTTPLYISAKTDGGTYTLKATTTVGSSPYTLTIANPTGYVYYVWHDWEPPTPVHTNGVWVGSVIERAQGAGNEKLVIVNGYITEDGVKIAPKKEEE